MNKSEKREHIRDAAATLFVEHGFENTTTRDIAKAAEISSAAIYYYFDSKEELLFQILDETITDGLRIINEIRDSDRDLKGKLSAVLDIYTRYYTVDTEKMKLLAYDQKSLVPEHKAILDRKQRDYVKALVDMLNDLKTAGEIVEIDTTILAFAFFGMVHWAHRWYNPMGKIGPNKLAEIFEQIFTKGIYLDGDD